MDGKPVYVADSQVLNDCMACARKAHYTFDKDLVPMIKPSYFETGGLLHDMLAPYYRLRRYRSRWAQNNKTHADIIDICMKIGYVHAAKLSLDMDEIEMTMNAFRDYTVFNANDAWDNILSVEEVASKILYEDNDLIILYEGKIDLSIALTNCPLMPIDHKTSKMRRDPNLLSNQFMGYCWLLDVNNIIENKIGFQKTLTPAEKFQRHTLSYSPPLLTEWKENSIYWLKKYIYDSSNNFYPANYTSCDKYSGCIYRDVCSSTADSREEKLTRMFNIKKWDVGKEGL